MKDVDYKFCDYLDVGRLISTTPQLFSGILKIRIGYFIRAMKYYLKFKGEKQTELEALAPNQLRRLFNKVLVDDDLTARQKRQIEGCLCRVNFPLTFKTV